MLEESLPEVDNSDGAEKGIVQAGQVRVLDDSLRGMGRAFTVGKSEILGGYGAKKLANLRHSHGVEIRMLKQHIRCCKICHNPFVSVVFGLA